MILIPDDPIIRCIERTGYPPSYLHSNDYDEWEEEDDFEGDGDVYYGNQTESF